MIAHLNAPAGPDLELPLAGHHFCIYSRYLNACFEAFHIMHVCDRTTDSHGGANTCIVRALRCRLTAIFVEAERKTWLLPNPGWTHESVLLLDAKPRIKALAFVHC